MSLADRKIICKKLQFLVTILSIWIQDSRFKAQKNFFNPTSVDSRFKIQGSEKTSSIQPLWIQGSRFKAEGPHIQEVFFWDLES